MHVFGVPIALVAMGLGALVLTGCGRNDKAPERAAVPPHSPESYMHDKEFQGQLAKERAEHRALLRQRNAITQKMKAKVDAAKARLGASADAAAIKAELEKDAEWRELYVQCTNANATVTAHRRATLGTVRRRITPKRPFQKQDKEGNLK